MSTDEFSKARTDKVVANVKSAMNNAADVMKSVEIFFDFLESQQKVGESFIKLNKFIAETNYFPEDMHEMHKQLHGIVDRVLAIE